MVRLALAAFAVLLALGLATPARAEGWVEAQIRASAVRFGQSPAFMVRVARCESDLDWRAIGAEGERGVWQIHPRGLWSEFLALGYTNPVSVYESSEFAARMFRDGRGGAWSCWHFVQGLRVPWWR